LRRKPHVAEAIGPGAGGANGRDAQPDHRKPKSLGVLKRRNVEDDELW
jgi:hypothetical protein